MPLPSRFPAIMGLLVFSLLLLQGCAGFSPAIEKPTIKVSSLQVMESEGLSQDFRIGLLMMNPNPRPLPVTGMSYTISLNGYDLISGVSNKIPTLAAYAETPVVIEGSADLFAALRLVNSLANEPQSTLRYELSAKVDLEGWRPSFKIIEDGLIELRLQQ